MPQASSRVRGLATGKFPRKPTTGAAHEARVKFGRTWGAINSALAKRLRAGAR